MPLYFGTIPPELRRLAIDIQERVSTARHHIDARNYGLADGWLEDALALLPVDTGEGGIIWPALEERTSA